MPKITPGNPMEVLQFKRIITQRKFDLQKVPMKGIDEKGREFIVIGILDPIDGADAVVLQLECVKNEPEPDHA